MNAKEHHARRNRLNDLLTLLLCLLSANAFAQVDFPAAKWQENHFQNIEPFDKSWWDLLRWKIEPGPQKWQKIETDYFPPPEKQVLGANLSWNVINHATVLLQTQGINILSDPVFSDRIPDLPIIGITRVRRPGILFQDLPKIDVVLISHDHYDHLDKNTLLKLYQRDKPMIVAGLKMAKLLQGFGIPAGHIIELDWWQSYQHQGVKIHFVPARHTSGRNLMDQNQRLWGGYYIESDWGKIYFAGDTGYSRIFDLIYKKYGAPNISFLPIGSYKPRWYMEDHYMNPDDAVKAHLDLHSRKSVAIHFATFQIADNSYQEPTSALIKAANRHQLNTPFIIPVFGKTTRQPMTFMPLDGLLNKLKKRIIEEIGKSLQ